MIKQILVVILIFLSSSAFAHSRAIVVKECDENYRIFRGGNSFEEIWFHDGKDPNEGNYSPYLRANFDKNGSFLNFDYNPENTRVKLLNDYSFQGLFDVNKASGSITRIQCRFLVTYS